MSEYRELVAKGSTVRLGGKRRKQNTNTQEEEALQRACFIWLDLASGTNEILSYAFHPANGGKRSKGEAGKLKAMGVKKGVPDILLPMPWRGYSGLAVELKSQEGKLTPEQADWLDQAKQGGYLTAVCRDLECFIAVAKNFLAGKKSGAGTD